MNRGIGIAMLVGASFSFADALPAQVVVFDEVEEAVLVEQVIVLDDQFVMEAIEVVDENDAENPAEQQEEQVFGPEIIDQWLFQNGDPNDTRKNLESKLTLYIADVDRACQLSEPQSKKLKLAGRSEIKLLFDHIDSHRRKIQQTRRTQRNINQLWQEIQPLRNLLQGGHFEDHSLFDKVVRKTLTEEQAPRFRDLVRERQQYRQQARLEMLLLSLDKQVPLKDAQRKELRTLLLELPAVPKGPYEIHALMYLASQVPEEKYRAILDERQWKSLDARFAQARGLSEWLKQSGALAADELDAEAPDKESE